MPAQRQATHDDLCREEIETWQASGGCSGSTWCSRAIRPSAFTCSIGCWLLQSADTLRTWLDNGVTIYVLGSLHGMASGADAATAPWSDVSATGRYHLDVY